MDILTNIMTIIVGILGLFFLGSFFLVIDFFCAYFVCSLIRHLLVRKLFDEVLHIKWLGVIIEVIILSVICFFGYKIMLNQFMSNTGNLIISILVSLALIIIFLVSYICCVKFLPDEEFDSNGGHYDGDWDGDMGQDM